MSELQNRVVPLIVEYDTFWTRYFYRLSKLQEKHEKRQALAQRAQGSQREDEEDIGWGDEEEEAEEEKEDEGRKAGQGAGQAHSAAQPCEGASECHGGADGRAAAGTEHEASEAADTAVGSPAAVTAVQAAPASPPVQEDSVPGAETAHGDGACASSDTGLKPSSGPSPKSESTSGEWCVLQSPKEVATAEEGEGPEPAAEDKAPLQGSGEQWEAGSGPAAAPRDDEDPEAFPELDVKNAAEEEDDDFDEDWGSSL
uniref:BSD domain-containing protein n=2 Tax=Tetraselmis sp. GSL018 TaxID=582737 RepID=A0A061R2E4_9CHLO